MEFAHSFWLTPLKAKKFTDIETAVKTNLICNAYSVECVHAYGHTITLYADNEGAELLKLIPYDKVVIVENTITTSAHFAASIKFEALKKMPLSSILIDGDIFLFKPTIYEMLKNMSEDVIVSYFEPKDHIRANYNYKLFNLIREAGFEYPYHTPKYEAVEGWLNTSLMKFNNKELKEEYLKQYEKHVKLLEGVAFGEVWPDVIIEQLHLTDLCREKDYTVKRIIENYPFGNAEQFASEIGFAHAGAMKKESLMTIAKVLYNKNMKLFEDLMQHSENFVQKVQKQD